MKSLILQTKDEQNNVTDIIRLARKILNDSLKSKVISRQEAIFQLMGLSLCSCSEFIDTVSISGNVKLGTNKASKSTFLYKYSVREKIFHNLSLYDYFNVYNNQIKKSTKIKIPHIVGGKIQSNDVNDLNYMRSILLVHMPWYQNFMIKTDTPDLQEKFIHFLHDKHNCPESVRLDYYRALRAQQMFNEPVALKDDIDYDNFAYKIDPNIEELVEIAGTFASNVTNFEQDQYNYDYGINYNWSKRNIQVS